MEPFDWRKREGLSLRTVARMLRAGSAMSVLRWERGERDCPNSFSVAYLKITAGKVGPEDLNRVRNRYLRTQATAAA